MNKMTSSQTNPESGKASVKVALPARVAAIDIGSVTCRMLLADVDETGLHELYRGYAITNLGEDVDATGYLKQEAMERVVAQLERFQEVIETYYDHSCDIATVLTIAVATSASRDASNADEFRSMLAKIGIEPRIISGENEAYLSFLGASSEFVGEDIVMIDIGGGSTEVAFGKAGESLNVASSTNPFMSHSFNVGCRRMTEKFFISDPPSSAELESARSWIFEHMQSYFSAAHDRGFSIKRVVAVAGTATSVVSIEKKMRIYDSLKVHKTVVSQEILIKIFDHLRKITLEERKQVIGLDPDRASVIVAGLLILIVVLELSAQQCFTASEADILQGIVLDATRK